MRDEKPELVIMVTRVYFEDDSAEANEVETTGSRQFYAGIYQGFSLFLKSALALKLASIFFIPTLTLGSETSQ